MASASSASSSSAAQQQSTGFFAGVPPPGGGGGGATNTVASSTATTTTTATTASTSTVGSNSSGAGKSTLAAESPPFNPQSHTNRGLLSVSPGPRSMGGSRSRSNSPYPHHHHHGGGGTGGNAAGGGSNSNSGNSINNNNNNANSNALPKYTFQYQGETLEIRNVWAENVEREMAVIRELIETYPYVAMDTEFPGIVAKPVTETFSADYHYKSLKVNVDLLKIIQLGLSFADEDGNFAPNCPCWQFNFQFDLEGDMFAQDSIDLLLKSGISFEDHAQRGIDPLLFGELLMVSGLVLDDRVKWVSFHSAYDYGYLIKLLTTTDLPAEEKTFLDLLHIYFPTIYDIKYMTSILDGHHFMGGLQRLADDLGCQRLGAEHQAGSDCLLTMATYFALVRAKFMVPTSSSVSSSTSSSAAAAAAAAATDGSSDKTDNVGTSGSNASTTVMVVDDSKFANELFGYGHNHTVRKGSNIHRDLSTGSALSNNSSDTL